MLEAQSLSLFECLQERGALEASLLDELYQKSQRSGEPLADVILQEGALNKADLLQHVAEFLGWEYLPSAPESIPDELIDIVQGSLARMYGVVPIEADDSDLYLLALDPFNSQIIDDLTFVTGKNIILKVADPDAVQNLIKVNYGDDDASIDDILKDMDSSSFEDDEDLSEEDLTAMASDTPIIRFVNLVLTQAIKDKASDIHFEPFEDEFKIRYRIDGALYEMAPPPRNLILPVTSRIKVISNLNISERRIPQDGRIKMTIAGRPVDLRVSTLPTQFGESVVLRVLDKSVVNLDLENLNMPDDVYGTIKEIIELPNGIFIVTGPTGSGKTTTLYSGLRNVNRVETKILTAEDPVEYEIEGIMQVPVNPAVGLTFAKALRSFLRQDPDIIMVGEIRDLETAQIAIQASLTGHLVLSTLHTNDAAGGVTRLIDMGVEPFLISASLEAILAQRLVRRICTSCRTSYEPSETLVEQLGLNPVDIGDNQFYYGKGCVECNQSGYRGRMGVYEMLRVTEAIRDLISDRAPALVIRQKALEQGMRTLREDGVRSIFDGATTIEEIIKYT
ncbi:MAG: Flp pilus assembly complex ATPase component TadA [Opitutales bacterium]|nr:Flp pilus assembly complex ATPase component TadA [Opitutales bacterium]MCH8540532.1 Flp pilus assembly complex ATPase component TadA [Opitutales bacterium]